jgi:hypothetical protein
VKAPLDSVQIGGFDKEEMVLSPMLGGEVTTGDNFKVVCGETILSFRSLLKRFQAEMTGFVSSGSNKVTFFEGPIYPTIKNYLLTAPTSPGVALTNDLHLYAYLKYAFLSIRGGYRRVGTPHGIGGAAPIYLAVTNRPYFAGDVPVVGTSSSYADVAPTLIGAAINPTAQNRSIAFETPSYTSARYSIGLAENGTGSAGYADEHINGWRVSSSFDADNANYFLSISAAAADDFSMSGFVGCPPRITLTTPP